MSTVLFHTTQLAIAEYALSANIKPYDVMGMRININFVGQGEQWVNPKRDMPLSEQFQTIYESAHYYRLFVASDPTGTNQKTGKSNGKAMFSADYVQAAQQTTNGDMFNMFKKFGVKAIGTNEVKASVSNDDIATNKLALLKQMFLDGDITVEQYNAKKALYENNAPTKSVDVLEKIKKTPKQNNPVVSDEKPMPSIIAKRIKGDSNGEKQYSIRNIDFKKIGVIAFDADFSANLVNEKNEFISKGKFVIVNIGKTSFTVKHYVA